MIKDACIAVVLSAIATEIFAEQEGVKSEPLPSASGYLDNERLTGDWGGARAFLEESGFLVSAENVFEYSSVIDGGVNEGDSSRNLFVADLEVDTETLFGLKGGTFFVQFLSVTAETGGSGDAGDLQGYTNIESESTLNVLYELWYQQVWLNERVRVKAGKVDANTEFAYVAPLQDYTAAGELTHSSAGFQPTIAGFPSYPDPAMSVNLFLTPYQGNEIQFAVGYGLYDGATGVDGIATGARGPSSFISSSESDDYFHISEGQFSWDEAGPCFGGSVSVGGYYHTGDWETFPGGIKHGTAGFYATLQQQLTAPDEDDADRGLYLFGQYGYGDDEVVDVEQVYSAGAVQNGAGRFRPGDLIGVYASYADLSDDAAAGFEKDELAIEAIYRFMITPAVSIQPGVKYILNPSGDASVDDAVVGQLRLGIVL